MKYVSNTLAVAREKSLKTKFVVFLSLSSFPANRFTVLLLHQRQVAVI